MAEGAGTYITGKVPMTQITDIICMFCPVLLIRTMQNYFPKHIVTLQILMALQFVLLTKTGKTIQPKQII